MEQVYDYCWRKFSDEAPLFFGEYLCLVDFGGADLDKLILEYNPDEKKGERWSEGLEADGSLADDSEVRWWTNLPPNPPRQ